MLVLAIEFSSNADDHGASAVVGGNVALPQNGTEVGQLPSPTPAGGRSLPPPIPDRAAKPVINWEWTVCRRPCTP